MERSRNRSEDAAWTGLGAHSRAALDAPWKELVAEEQTPEERGLLSQRSRRWMMLKHLGRHGTRGAFAGGMRRTKEEASTGERRIRGRHWMHRTLFCFVVKNKKMISFGIINFYNGANKIKMNPGEDHGLARSSALPEGHSSLSSGIATGPSSGALQARHRRTFLWDARRCG